MRYWLLAGAAVLLIGAGVLVASRPLSATFAWTGTNPTTGNVVTVPDSGTCISALDDFLGRYGPPSTDTTGFGQQNYANYDTACWGVIHARSRIAWLLIGLGVLTLLGMGVLFIGESIRRRSPTPQLPE